MLSNDSGEDIKARTIGKQEVSYIWLLLPCFENEAGGGLWYCVCWPYLGLPCQMWFLWWGTIRYLYGSFTSVVIRFRCAVLYGALTGISHLAAVSQNGALLTYRRTRVYTRVLYFHFLTSLLSVIHLSSFILRFWCPFHILIIPPPLRLHPSLPAPGPFPNWVRGHSQA